MTRALIAFAALLIYRIVLLWAHNTAYRPYERPKPLTVEEQREIERKAKGVGRYTLETGETEINLILEDGRVRRVMRRG
jgi:membrane protein implicated in regulation of membrane protease activity